MSSYTHSLNPKFVLSEEQINLLKEAFDLYDTDKEGKIDYHELKLTLKAFGFKSTKDEIRQIKEEIDTGDKISFEDFIDIMSKKFAQRNPREEASLAFDLFDEDKKGMISLKNLKKAVKEINENIPDSELQGIVDEFDSNGDGYITKEDFLKIIDEAYL